MEAESLSGIKWYVPSMIEISEELVMKHEKMGSLQHIKWNTSHYEFRRVSAHPLKVSCYFSHLFSSKGPICIFFLSTIFPAAFEKCGKLHALLLCSKIVKSVEELKRECGASNWGSTLEKPKNLMQILFSKRQEHKKKGGKKERDTQRGQSESQEGTPSLFHFVKT